MFQHSRVRDLVLRVFTKSIRLSRGYGVPPERAVSKECRRQTEACASMMDVSLKLNLHCAVRVMTLDIENEKMKKLDIENGGHLCCHQLFRRSRRREKGLKVSQSGNIFSLCNRYRRAWKTPRAHTEE